MTFIIIVSKFFKVVHREGTARLGFSGFVSGRKIKKILVLEAYGHFDLEAVYLVVLKNARIRGEVLCGELHKAKKLDEVNF
jgi:hypothetical protein